MLVYKDLNNIHNFKFKSTANVTLQQMVKRAWLYCYYKLEVWKNYGKKSSCFCSPY